MALGDCGVYTITSPSGKQYVGSAVNFRLRWSRHRWALRRGKHENSALSRAYAKYGEEGLAFEKVLLCSRGNAVRYEQLVIDALKPAYNASPTAGSLLGIRHSAEVRARMSAAAKKRPPFYPSPETREKRSVVMKGRISPMFGRRHLASTRARMSEAAKKQLAATPRIYTPERRGNMSRAQIEYHAKRRGERDLV